MRPTVLMLVSVLAAMASAGPLQSAIALPSQAPTLEAAQAYISANCQGVPHPVHDEVVVQRIWFEGALMKTEYQHNGSGTCRAHKEVASLDVTRVAVRPYYETPRIEIRCIKTGPGEERCITTGLGHNGCWAEVTRQATADYMVCRAPRENLVRAFETVQRHLGGPVPEYRDPFGE